MYDAIIFDKDGVLVHRSGRDVFDRAARDALADLGVTDPPEPHVERLSTVPREAIQREFDDIASAHEIDPEALLLRRDERAVEHQTAAAETGKKPPYDDVEAIKSLDVPLGVVSNNQDGTVSGVLSTHGLADHFEAITGRDHGIPGLRRRKPDPHYLEQVIDALDVTNPLYVGDSGTDLLAAERAGIDGAFLRRQHRHDYELPTEPVHEASDLTELVQSIS